MTGSGGCLVEDIVTKATRRYLGDVYGRTADSDYWSHMTESKARGGSQAHIWDDVNVLGR
jgi:hypothetical protein